MILLAPFGTSAYPLLAQRWSRCRPKSARPLLRVTAAARPIDPPKNYRGIRGRAHFLSKGKGITLLIVIFVAEFIGFFELNSKCFIETRMRLDLRRRWASRGRALHGLGSHHPGRRRVHSTGPGGAEPTGRTFIGQRRRDHRADARPHSDASAERRERPHGRTLIVYTCLTGELPLQSRHD
jgi:hypothetical protein